MFGRNLAKDHEIVLVFEIIKLDYTVATKFELPLEPATQVES